MNTDKYKIIKCPLKNILTQNHEFNNRLYELINYANDVCFQSYHFLRAYILKLFPRR